jgi:hypothetical protein
MHWSGAKADPRSRTVIVRKTVEAMVPTRDAVGLADAIAEAIGSRG